MKTTDTSAPPGEPLPSARVLDLASARPPQLTVIDVWSAERYEEQTLHAAQRGDDDAAREALRLCREGLDCGNLSKRLREYLAQRLWLIEQALVDAEELRSAKESSGSIRSSRDAAIASALGINRGPGRRADPLPEWHRPYAALAALLVRGGLGPERVKAALDEARRDAEGPNVGLDRSTAGEIIENWAPMRELSEEHLKQLAGALTLLLPTFLPHT